MPQVYVPLLGHSVYTQADRAKMKVKDQSKKFLRAVGTEALALPVVPATFDLSKSESIKFPMDGNDQEGDCYYAAILHMVNLFIGQYGGTLSYAVSQILARYEQLSGGDNGLSDSDVYPEWEKGILGPNGPHKIRDYLVLDSSDKALVDLAMWCFTGALYTCSLPGGAANNAGPGVTWDYDGSGSVGGHAIILTGKNGPKSRDLRTWGISPPIKVTDAFIDNNDPEIVVVWSDEQFDPTTRLNHAGLSWEDCRAIWVAHGGKDPGVAPWVTPVPVPPVPVPPAPTPGPVTPLTVTVPDQVVQVIVKGGTFAVSGTLPEPSGALPPGLLTWIQLLLQILALFAGGQVAAAEALVKQLPEAPK